MRKIALEEYFLTKSSLEGPGGDMFQMGGSVVQAIMGPSGANIMAQLLDLGDQRISEMDAAGVDVQVLSFTRGLDSVQGEDEAVNLARNINDQLATAVELHPTRFVGFATLPTMSPEKSADELERTVKEYGFKGAMIHGHTRGRYLDDKFFWPILARAQELEVPIYLHPAPPPKAVLEASYSGNYTRDVTMLFSTGGWGWHIDPALHALRMILGGVFDNYPNFQLVIGHLREALLFMMPRIERALPQQVTKLNKPIGNCFRENVHYTISDWNYTPAFLDLFLQVGVDRIMFSADYPYSSLIEDCDFLERLPVSPKDKESIAHGNAEMLLRI
ncbi:MAG: amidohydrolase family protein [Nitrososphaerales archaeon]